VKEFSQYLKSERLRAGLSLDDIASKVDVSISVLQALEAGLFAEIGPSSLVYSYLQAYSRALKIYQPLSIGEQEPLGPVDSPNLPEAQHKAATPGVSWARRYLGMIVFLLTGVVALGVFHQAGWVWWRDSNPSNRQVLDTGVIRESAPRLEAPPETAPLEDPTTGEDGRLTLDEKETRLGISSEEVTAENEVAKGPQARQSPTTVIEKPAVGETSSIAMSQLHKENDPGAKAAFNDAESSTDRETAAVAQERPYHRFEIDALQLSWVQVRKDNKKTESALLRPGETREWEVTQEIQIVVGNAGGVQMRWDGNPVNLGGKPGQVLRFQLPYLDLTGRSPQ